MAEQKVANALKASKTRQKSRNEITTGLDNKNENKPNLNVKSSRISSSATTRVGPSAKVSKSFSDSQDGEYNFYDFHL